VTSQLQYLRKCNLILSNASNNGLDLSNLRITFTIKKTDGQTPNTASLRIYGLAEDTENQIVNEFTRVDLQAGYESNYGIIFSGTSKWIRKGRENNVSRYLEIQASDGDRAYNFAVVNSTLSKGATQRDQINQVGRSMQEKGVTMGYIAPDDTQALPRGKVLYGSGREYMRQSATTTGASWSIQDGKMQVVPLSSVLPNSAVVLNAGSGLIGTPEQSNEGISFTCLLNPTLQIAGQVQIDKESISAAGQGSEEEAVPEISTTGFYRIISLELIGDTRGQDWYCKGVGLSIDSTMPRAKSVKDT
jgi:hypothetical protein